jgi:hypothetical protein
MRIFLTSLLAFVLSLLAAGMAAVKIAEATKAREEFILVFFAIGIIAILANVVFAIAQARQDPPAAVAATGRWLLAWLGLMLIGVLILSILANRNLSDTTRDIPLLVGFVLPGAIIIMVQWLVVRWRVARAASADAPKA